MRHEVARPVGDAAWVLAFLNEHYVLSGYSGRQHSPGVSSKPVISARGPATTLIGFEILHGQLFPARPGFVGG